jgi:hypothetical protein
MNDLATLGRLLVAVGLLLALVGGTILLAGRVPWLGSGLGWIGRLPGDIVVRRGPVTIYAPIATSLLLSVLLTLAFRFLVRR